MRAANAELDRSGVPRLKRVLTVWDLAFYGMVCGDSERARDSLRPGAGEISWACGRDHPGRDGGDGAHSHQLRPDGSFVSSAGSAYTYVGRGLHPYLGFVSGWAMLLDYVVCPVFCVIFGTLSLVRSLPAIPYPVGAALLAGGITYFNLRGIRSTARTNQVLLVLMFIVLLSYSILQFATLLSTRGSRAVPHQAVLQSRDFQGADIASATSFAALTYLGFDAVTTLAEDVRNPRRNVMLAAVSVCAFTGLFGGLLVYLGQMVWPDYNTYPNVETAFIDVTRRVGGVVFFAAMASLLVVAKVGAGLTTQVGAARLLYGMGRDDLIPRRFFSYLDPVRNTPNHNIWLIGIIAYIGALIMSYEVTAEILNFGAFFGFMGVNLAVVWQFWVRGLWASPRVPGRCAAAGRRIRFLRRNLVGVGGACQDRRRHLVRRRHGCLGCAHPGFSRETVLPESPPTTSDKLARRLPQGANHGVHFRRGFHVDHVALAGENFCTHLLRRRSRDFVYRGAKARSFAAARVLFLAWMKECVSVSRYGRTRYNQC